MEYLGIPQYGFREKRRMKTYYGEEKIQGRDTSSPSTGDRKCWKMDSFMWLCDHAVSQPGFSVQIQLQNAAGEIQPFC